MTTDGNFDRLKIALLCSLPEEAAKDAIQRIDHYESEIRELREKLKCAEEALYVILFNVSLDWYCQHFGRSEISNGIKTGVVERIHNAETKQRIMGAFKIAREALSKIRGGE